MSGYQQKLPSDWTPLHIAVWRHEVEQTRSLVNSSSVNREDSKGWTPVHLACASENSRIFYSHQVHKKNREGLYPTFEAGREKPPRGISYSIWDDNEPTNALGILEILLPHSLVGIRRSRFPTPLHCAANSGWLSHAQALVEAGSPVYTGPDCSPLCWAEGGSGGDHPVAVYLREILGERGLSMIEADHARAQRAPVGDCDDNEPFQPSNAGERSLPRLPFRISPTRRLELPGLPAEDLVDEPSLNALKEFGTNSEAPLAVKRVLPRPEPKQLSIDSNGLCQTCAGISFRELCRPKGYFHLRSVIQLQQSAMRCTFCKIIYEVLSEGNKLEQHARSQIIIRISNGIKRHRGICTDPPILRTLEFKLCAGCTCLRTDWSVWPPDRSKCHGTCEGNEVYVSIFSDKETTLMIPTELGLIDDPAYDAPWSIQKGITIDADPLSGTSLKVIQKWLENCGTTHQHCKRDHASNIPLPTRVIDVNSKDGTSIRLCQGIGKHNKYLALSHRWVGGPMPQWVTTHDTLESRHKWFALETVPASVADAVRVTRRLGLQYLWVDCLCIIQDSPKDWEVESSQMARVYANAYITLFADCGRDDDHGFLFPRETYPSMPVVLPTRDGNTVKLNIRKSSGGSFKPVQFSDFATNVEGSYLSDRGWIFQERVLSRRILHFGKDQMFWECSEGTFAEDGHVVSQRGQRECSQQDFLFSKLACTVRLDSPAPLSPGSIASQWEYLVNTYSALKLTKGEDKLPALSGLAAALHSRSKDDEYIAGLWREALPTQLAWAITNKKPEKAHKGFQARDYGVLSSGGIMETDYSFIHASQLFPRPKTYQAPSFSWAAVNGQIEFHGLPKPCARIESIALDITTENPYGRLKHGSVAISGPLRQAWSCGPFKTDIGGLLCRRKEGYIPLYDLTGWPFGYMLPDSKDDVDVQDVWCFKLGEKMFGTSVFLVLVPITKQETGRVVQKYRRIGLGETKDGEGGFFVEAEAEVKTIELL